MPVIGESRPDSRTALVPVMLLTLEKNFAKPERVRARKVKIVAVNKWATTTTEPTFPLDPLTVQCPVCFQDGAWHMEHPEVMAECVRAMSIRP